MLQSQNWEPLEYNLGENLQVKRDDSHPAKDCEIVLFFQGVLHLFGWYGVTTKLARTIYHLMNKVCFTTDV